MLDYRWSRNPPTCRRAVTPNWYRTHTVLKFGLQSSWITGACHYTWSWISWGWHFHMQCLVQIMTNQVHFFLFPPLFLDCWYLCWAVPHYTKCRNDSFPLLIDVVDITAFGCFISLPVIIFYNLAAWWKLIIIIVLQQRLNLKGILQQVWQIARWDIFRFNHSNVTFFNQFGSLGFDEINNFKHIDFIFI